MLVIVWTSAVFWGGICLVAGVRGGVAVPLVAAWCPWAGLLRGGSRGMVLFSGAAGTAVAIGSWRW